MVKISVIIPIYNADKSLEKCLESIVNQTLSDIEIICVNDGSKDNSLGIVNKYASIDQRIKVINKINTGYGHSMNIGMNHATGNYIGVVESDDFIDLDMFKIMFDKAEENSVEVIKTNYYHYNSDSDKNIFYENLLGCQYNTIIYPINEQKIFNVTPSIWSALYKRKFLIENNIKFNETPGASFQDTSFAFKVWASAKKVYLLKDAFLHYRVDNMDSSVKSSSKIFCICDEYKEIERFLDKDKYKKDKLSELIFALKYKSYKWNYERLISSYQYTFLLRMIEEYKKAENEHHISDRYLTKLELNQIYSIIREPDNYFRNTAKDYRDDRLCLSSTLNLQFYKDGLLNCINKYNNVIIFGAGVIAERVAKILLYNEKVKNILCFAVSNLSGNIKKLLELPVYSINDVLKYSNNSVVLIATKERDQYEIIRLLKSLDFNNIVSIDSTLLGILSNIK